MLIKQSVLTIFTLLITFIVLLVFDFGYILSGIITLSIVVISYIIYVNIIQRKRYKLIEENLDPEAFVKATEKQFETIGNDKKANGMLSNDLAAGLMSMGKYDEAKKILKEINIKDIPKQAGILLSYLNNIMVVNYKLNNVDEANRIYEDFIRKYKVKRDNEQNIMNLILANKSLEEKDCKKSRELFRKVLEKNKSERLKIDIEFDLAIIDEKEGNIKEAIRRYKYVANNGNKLYSASLARERLEYYKS